MRLLSFPTAAAFDEAVGRWLGAAERENNLLFSALQSAVRCGDRVGSWLVTRDERAILPVLLASLALFAGVAPAQPLPDGSGKELVQTICTECHDTTRITAQQKTKSEWAVKVTEMLQEEPDVTETERETIVNYLSASFPATARVKKVNVNRAAAKDLEAGLDLSSKDSQAIVRYRDEKGSFKNLDDLKKVPGVDADKIEAKKERLEF